MQIAESLINWTKKKKELIIKIFKSPWNIIGKDDVKTEEKCQRIWELREQYSCLLHVLKVLTVLSLTTSAKLWERKTKKQHKYWITKLVP